MPGISVTAASANGEIMATGVTDADGWYRLTGLGDGEHVLVAGGHEPVSTAVEVISGETTSVTVRIGSAAAGSTEADSATNSASAADSAAAGRSADGAGPDGPADPAEPIAPPAHGNGAGAHGQDDVNGVTSPLGPIHGERVHGE